MMDHITRLWAHVRKRNSCRGGRFLRPNVRVQVAARRHITWILSFKLREALPRLTCNDLFGKRPHFILATNFNVLVPAFAVTSQHPALGNKIRVA